MKRKTELYIKAKAAYYAGDPIMSDAQFDGLEDEIRNADPDNAVLKIVGAPLPNPKGKSQRAKHLIPMGSQEKVNTFGELAKWQSLRANDPGARFHVSYKADGGSVALYYSKGRLVQAVSRGDGAEGENITHQTPFLKGTPLTLDEPLDVGVRCEAVVTLADWGAADPAKETNPRNVATGILGRLDCTKSHHVTLLAFDIEALPGTAPSSLTAVKDESGKSEMLEKLGFKTTPWKGRQTLDGVLHFFEQTRKLREEDRLDFWIDGLVVKYESLETQEALGITDGRPKGQVAWKFAAEEGKSVLREVQWQVGQSGAVTPVGILKPVRLGGSTVNKASLANAGNIATLEAFLGAPVTVVKAGDIIPFIKTVIKKYRCPECGFEGSMEEQLEKHSGK